MTLNDIQKLALQVYQYAKDRDFAGWDPYDGLNSPIFKATPLNSFRITRLAWIQFFKHCPINLRPLFLVPKERNPKGIALFASAALNLHVCTKKGEYLTDALGLLDWLKNNYSKGYSGYAWGYNFPWQARHVLFSPYFPTIVATSFVAMSFIDGYEATGDTSLLDVAISAAKFIFTDFHIHREGNNIAFGYGPADTSCVYNATALGGQLFARLYKATREEHYRTMADGALSFVASRRQKNGSWLYGDHATQQWIDSFHTGFNLIAFKTFQECCEETKFDNVIKQGFDFYQKELFAAAGEPKYFSHSFYPIDIHTCAVAILMFSEFGLPERACEIAQWTVKKLWNEKGWFDYQITKYYRNSIAFMRWSQAWISYALSLCLLQYKIISE